MVEQKIFEVLAKDRVRNMNLLNFMQQYPVQSVERVGESVLVRGTSDHPWVYISSANAAEYSELVQRLRVDDEYFAIIEDWMLPALLEGRCLIWQLTCMKLYFPGNVEVPFSEDSADVRELEPEWSTYIFENSKYKEFTSVEYIMERIEMGVSLGIFHGERLVAWLMTHDDGAMGFLHVLPEERGKGYAQVLTYAMIHRLRERGEIPFVHIEESNAASMGLALKLGFQQDRRIHWFQRQG